MCNDVYIGINAEVNMNSASNKKKSTEKKTDDTKPQSPAPIGSPIPNPEDDVLQEIYNEQMQEIADEQLQEIADAEMQDIVDEQMQEIVNDELNTILMQEIAGETDPYLKQVVDKAKEQKLDQEIIKEFRSAKARKTTRTTFSLAARTMEILAKLEEQYDYSPRMIFQEASQLPLPEGALSHDPTTPDVSSEKRTRKTFVIDSQSLQAFNDNASSVGISRDQVVDTHVAALYHLLVQANKAEMQIAMKYRDLAVELDGKLSEIADQAEAEFGSKDHPVANGFSIAAIYLMNVGLAIDSFLEDGIWEERS